MLEVRQAGVRYGEQQVLDGLTMSIGAGQLCALVGPSGCGKTTLLRLIAGFEPAASGTVEIAGRCVAGGDLHIAPEKRGIGIVFQDHVLFPHLDVAANIRFGLHRVPDAARERRLVQMLEAVSLQGMEDRYPHELSGGQQQRVALARALAPGPSILLLDEPFASLDQRLRGSLASEIRDILVKAGTTAILVTHDIGEAFAFADHVGVIWGGRLVQWGSPAQLYRHPAERCVAEFVGRGAFVPGRVVAANRLETELGPICCDVDCDYPVGTSIDVFLRAEDIVPGDDGDIVATVRERQFKGATTLYRLATDTLDGLLSHFPHQQQHQLGDQVRVRLDVRHPVYFLPRLAAV